MNKQEALEYYDELRAWIEKEAREIGVEDTAKKKVEECITVVPESSRIGFFVLKDKPVSYRLGNIRFDFKNALVPALELVTAINAPESTFNYIQLLVATALFVGKATKMEYKKLDAFIVIAIHDREKKGRVSEENLVDQVLKEYKESEGKPLERKAVYESINRLYKTKVVDIEDGYISLAETVWGEK